LIYLGFLVSAFIKIIFSSCGAAYRLMSSRVA
jgi:hypothetical protein